MKSPDQQSHPSEISALGWFNLYSKVSNFFYWENCESWPIFFTVFTKLCNVHCLFFPQVREIFAEYDPNFLPLSLDEAYLDITDHLEERLVWPEERRRYVKADGVQKDDSPAGTELNNLGFGVLWMRFSCSHKQSFLTHFVLDRGMQDGLKLHFLRLKLVDFPGSRTFFLYTSKRSLIGL